MVDSIDGASVVKLLKKCCETLRIEHVDEFRILDARIGDGDLGFTLEKGCKAVEKTLDQIPFDDIGEILTKCGKAFNQANPSTFGILAENAFTESGKICKGKTFVTLNDIEEIFKAAIEGIRKRGKAELGDKTMLDALHPAVLAIEKASKNALPISVALKDASDAAESGLKQTITMQAKRGKARAFGTHTIGEQDPGATVVFYFLRTLAIEVKHTFEKG